MSDKLKELSLTDLISLKRHLLSRETGLKLQGKSDAEVLEVTNRWVVVEKEIQERIENLFQ